MDQIERTPVELLLSPEEYRQLIDLAAQRQEPPESVARAAVVEWLQNEVELEKGRTMMRELGRGLGRGPESNNTAREHDAVLYSRSD